MRIVLEIDPVKWMFVEPMLKSFVVSEELDKKNNDYIDWETIYSLKCGKRIANSLRNGKWSSAYSPDGKNYKGEQLYSVLTVGDLKRVTKREFLKQRNTGEMSWSILQEYIETL